MATPVASISTALKGVRQFTIPVAYATFGTSALDILTNWTPGYAFKLMKLECATTGAVGTGASASQTISMTVSGVAVTGGSLALVLADTTTMGNVKAASAITAGSVGTATDTLSVKLGAGGTAFTAGSGMLIVTLQKLDG